MSWTFAFKTGPPPSLADVFQREQRRQLDEEDEWERQPVRCRRCLLPPLPPPLPCLTPRRRRPRLGALQHPPRPPPHAAHQ